MGLIFVSRKPTRRSETQDRSWRSSMNHANGNRLLRNNGRNDGARLRSFIAIAFAVLSAPE